MSSGEAPIPSMWVRRLCTKNIFEICRSHLYIFMHFDSILTVCYQLMTGCIRGGEDTPEISYRFCANPTGGPEKKWGRVQTPKLFHEASPLLVITCIVILTMYRVAQKNRTISQCKSKICFRFYIYSSFIHQTGSQIINKYNRLVQLNKKT